MNATNIQTIKRNGKPEYVVLPVADYEALIEAAEDAEDIAALDEFHRKLAAGEEEMLPSKMVDALLEGANPIKVWREHRGLTQETLAQRAGISKPFLCQIEAGERQGAIKTLRAIAKVLKVDVEDLAAHLSR